MTRRAHFSNLPIFFCLLVASSTDGVVEVYLVDYLVQTISNSVHFKYTDQRKAKEDCVEGIKTLEELQKMFSLLCAKMGKMNLTSNDTNNANETNLPGKHD